MEPKLCPGKYFFFFSSDQNIRMCNWKCRLDNKVIQIPYLPVLFKLLKLRITLQFVSQDSYTYSYLFRNTDFALHAHYDSMGQNSETGLTGLKSNPITGYWQYSWKSWGVRESLFPCLFQVLETTCIPWLMAPASIFRVIRGGSSPFHTIISLVL